MQNTGFRSTATRVPDTQNSLTMGFFDRFRKPKADSQFEQGFPMISYGMAYMLIPHGVFHNFERLSVMWKSMDPPASALFYTTGCKMQNTEPEKEWIGRYHAHFGRLDEITDYYLMEFPKPPPVCMKDFEAASGKKPVLAPHFCAVLHQPATGIVSYYILGQSPDGGTTFRSITADGVNSNLGPGPEPTMKNFLELLKDRGDR